MLWVLEFGPIPRAFFVYIIFHLYNHIKYRSLLNKKHRKLIIKGAVKLTDVSFAMVSDTLNHKTYVIDDNYYIAADAIEALNYNPNSLPNDLRLTQMIFYHQAESLCFHLY